MDGFLSPSTILSTLTRGPVNFKAYTIFLQKHYCKIIDVSVFLAGSFDHLVLFHSGDVMIFHKLFFCLCIWVRVLNDVANRVIAGLCRFLWFVNLLIMLTMPTWYRYNHSWTWRFSKYSTLLGSFQYPLALNRYNVQHNRSNINVV